VSKLKDMKGLKGLSLFGIMNTKYFSFILTDFFLFSSMRNQCYQAMDFLVQISKAIFKLDQMYFLKNYFESLIVRN
jgi:hypothetical protein